MGSGDSGTMSFGFESATDKVLEGIDLSRKRAIVTDASGGSAVGSS